MLFWQLEIDMDCHLLQLHKCCSMEICELVQAILTIVPLLLLPGKNRIKAIAKNNKQIVDEEVQDIYIEDRVMLVSCWCQFLCKVFDCAHDVGI